MVHETKFLIPAEKAAAVLAWARAQMEPDPHGHGPHGDEYLVQSIYLDTPQWHVFRKVSSYGRAKYRVRRYGSEPWIFLERKLKRGGIVRKRRTTIDLEALPTFNQLPDGQWYDRRLQLRQLVPTCFIQYERVARQKMTSDGLLRLTVDRALAFSAEVGWTWPQNGATPFLPESMILELKYLHMPALAKRCIADFNLNPGPASKYRMALRASSLAPQILALDPDAARPELDGEMAADPALRVA